MEFKFIQIIFPLFFSTILFINLNSQITPSFDNLSTDSITNKLINNNDTIPVDSTITDSTKKINENQLQFEIKSNADDRITHYRDKKYSEFVGNAEIEYGPTNLKAGYIKVDWATDKVFARGLPDSLGVKSIQKPIFNQADTEIKVDSIVYNLKTKKALIYRFKSDFEQGIHYGEKVKRISDSIYYFYNYTFTTDQDSIPDYVIRTKKAKFIKDKNIITGTSNLEIHGVPTPLLLPLGFFPSSSSGTAGILIPTYGEQDRLGFFLQGLGFYIPFGDYADFTSQFDFYSKGTWALSLSSNYALRYRFRGNVSFQWENQISGTKGLDNYSKSRLYSIIWSHSQDQKANPNFTFSSSVNVSSSSYYKNSFNRVNELNNKFQNNTTNSSISLRKQFESLPISMSMNITQSQNSNSKRINMSLPDLTVNMRRISPFASKTGSKKGLIKSFGVDYSFNSQNKIDIHENNFFNRQMFDSARIGARHIINLSTSANVFKYWAISIRGKYNDNWEFETIRKDLDIDNNKIIDVKVKGFKSFREYSFNTSISTVLYGIKRFKKGSFIDAIRHTITPSFGFSYRPDFSNPIFGYYKTYTTPEGLEKIYTPFERAVYGRPSEGKQSTLNFGFNNNFEAKIRSNTNKFKYDKIKILDVLNINSSYNLAIDSFNLSQINVTASNTFLNNLVKVNFNSSFDPYQIIKSPVTKFKRINKLGIPRLNNLTASTTFQINNNTFKSKSNKKNNKNKDSSLKNQSQDSDRDFKNDNDPFSYDKFGYAKFIVPWSLNVSFNYGISKSGFESTERSTLNLSGNFSFTPYWTVDFNTGYDFDKSTFNYTRLGFKRLLRSFELRFDWVPFGNRRTYYFYFGIRASLLKDLKYDQRNFRDTNPKF